MILDEKIGFRYAGGATASLGRYSVLPPAGELLVRNVSSSDDGVSYRCHTRHKLTGKVKLSDTAGRVIVNRECELFLFGLCSFLTGVNRAKPLKGLMS